MSPHHFLLNLVTVMLVATIVLLWGYGRNDAVEKYGLLVVAFMVGRVLEVVVV